MTALSEHLSDAYGDLAASGLYDAWVASPAYRRWIVGLVELARTHGLAGPRMLDVGCGTGLSTVPMVELGLEVTGCDPSIRMLKAAEAKLDGRARLVRSGLPGLPVLGEFDLVAALNDVVNHVLDPGEMREAVAAMASNLARSGLLVLDATTLAGYRGFFATTGCRERDGAFFAWRGLTSPQLEPAAKAQGILDAFAERPPGCWRRVTARFEQRHHPHADVLDALRAAGLHVLATFGQHDDGRRDPRADELVHIKRIYLARKP